MFNQKVEFSLTRANLEKVKILFKIFSYCQEQVFDNRTVLLHWFELGSHTTGSSLQHWKNAIRTNKATARWHTVNYL